MIEIPWMKVGAALALALVGACGDDGGHGRGDGVLGFANFRWKCAGPGDIACIPGRVTDFPRGVALGSTFELSFVLHDEVPVDAGWIEPIGSARTELLSSNGGPVDGYDYGHGTTMEPRASFLAREGGEITLLAFANDDAVADYVTLTQLSATRLAVVRDCRVSACDDGVEVGSVFVGTTTDLRVEPYAADQLLVGHVDYEWESLTPELLELDANGNVVTLEPLRKGTAYVQVRGAGREETVAIEVLSNVSSEGPHRGPLGGTEGETEGSTTAGSESGSDGTGTGTDTGTDTDPGTTSGTSTTGGT